MVHTFVVNKKDIHMIFFADFLHTGVKLHQVRVFIAIHTVQIPRRYIGWPTGHFPVIERDDL
jgi:hypothetical protein